MFRIVTSVFALTYSVGVAAAVGASFPPDIGELKNLSVLEGEMHTGFGEKRTFAFRPGLPQHCRRSAHPMGAGIVIFNCGGVQGPSLAIDGENVSIALTGLQVRHQYYRPSPYDPPRPWEIQKAGWIRIYAYEGVYQASVEGKSLPRRFALETWLFFDAPETIAVANVTMGLQKYRLDVSPVEAPSSGGSR
jgi:hypothetical protein